MRLDALIYLLARRLRVHPVQELLAVAGVAIGVALAYAVMTSSGSVAGAADELARRLAGSADVQLLARSDRGFDARVLAQVRAVAGVTRAAPVLEQRGMLATPGRRAPVRLLGLNASFVHLLGASTGGFVLGALSLTEGVGLPAGTARALGIAGAGAAPAAGRGHVLLSTGGRAAAVRVAGVLGSETIGPLADARIAVLPLARLQELSGLTGRATRVLVDLDPARAAGARRALAALAGAHGLALAPIDAEPRMLALALAPSGQATAFFAAVAALLAFLFAFSAVLVTAPERRRAIAGLRVHSGFTARQLVTMTAVHALVLGGVASTAGVLAGIPLARTLLHESPDYLAPAFVLSGQTVLRTLPLLIAGAGGMLASCLAAAIPLVDLRRDRSLGVLAEARGAPGQTVSPRTRRLLTALGALAAALATGVALALPSAALLAAGLLALATVLAVPAAFAGLLRLVAALAARLERLRMLGVAVLALRATTARALALAAIGAVAVFGSVAIGGAREDLLRGIARYTADYVGTADLWVTNPGDNQATQSLRVPGLAKRVAAVPGVAAVRSYRGAFLDVGDRRVWVIARPADDPRLLPASQVVRGDLARATARLRGSGWVVLSEELAGAWGVGLGDVVTLPAPAGVLRARLAATTTNLGWSPGVVAIGERDHRRAWGSDSPSALEVELAPGARPGAVRAAIARVGGDGVEVRTAAERAAAIAASARAGLGRLGEISLLLLAAAVLAMATAMGASIWQSRGRLAALRVQHFRARQIWRILLLESAIVVGAGCAIGAVTGVAGQLVVDRYLRGVTGFPLDPALAGAHTLKTCAVAAGAALLVVALPGWIAAHASPRLAFHE